MGHFRFRTGSVSRVKDVILVCAYKVPSKKLNLGEKYYSHTASLYQLTLLTRIEEKSLSLIVSNYHLMCHLTYSGSSSKNKMPLCAREISPGLGVDDPPTKATAEQVWCGERKGRWRQ